MQLLLAPRELTEPCLPEDNECHPRVSVEDMELAYPYVRAQEQPLDACLDAPAGNRLADGLSLARLIGSIPVGVGLIKEPRKYIVPALMLMLYATDIADGWSARRCGGATERGAKLDKWADRALSGAVYASVMASDSVPSSIKEMTVVQKGYTASAVLRYRHAGEVLPASRLAKPSHVVRSLGLAASAVSRCFPEGKPKRIIERTATLAIAASAVTSACITTERHLRLTGDSSATESEAKAVSVG